MKKSKYKFKKKAELGVQEALLNKQSYLDGIADSESKIQENRANKQGVEDAISNQASKLGPLGKVATVGGAAGNFIGDKATLKDGSVKKGQYALGKATKYASTGAALGSNFGPVGTALGAGLGAATGVVSGLKEAGNINYQVDENKKQKKVLDNQMRLQSSVKDRVQANQAEDGKKKIYIKPENRGKFNATKKATGKTTEELTHSSNPVTRKRAIFAQNAAKWNKKEEGEESVKIPLDEMIEEHEELTKVLKSPSKSDDKKEFKKQNKELNKYKKLDKEEDEREIETEGREPIFSPKDANGNRKLLYYNPNDPTHKEGGVKAKVVPKSKYTMKKGNSDVVIPEGSAIITAKNNKNKKALIAYKKGDKKTLEKVIKQMPEDKISKKKNALGNPFTIATDPEKEMEKSLDSKLTKTDNTEITPYTGLQKNKVNLPKFDLNESLNKAATVAPTAFNIGKGLFGKVEKTKRNFYNPETLKYQDASNPLRKAAQDEYLQTREELRRGAPNASTYVANAQMAANQKYKRKEGIENTEVQRKLDVQNQNVGIKNQAALTNLNLKNQYNNLDLQNKSRKTDYLTKGLEGMSGLAQQAKLDKNRAESDDVLTDTLSSDNYKFDKISKKVTSFFKKEEGVNSIKPKYKKKK